MSVVTNHLLYDAHCLWPFLVSFHQSLILSCIMSLAYDYLLCHDCSLWPFLVSCQWSLTISCYVSDVSETEYLFYVQPLGDAMVCTWGPHIQKADHHKLCIMQISTQVSYRKPPLPGSQCWEQMLFLCIYTSLVCVYNKEKEGNYDNQDTAAGVYTEH